MSVVGRLGGPGIGGVGLALRHGLGWIWAGEGRGRDYLDYRGRALFMGEESSKLER